jgi:hypothetical protein
MNVKLMSRTIFISVTVVFLIWLALAFFTGSNLAQANQPTIPELLVKKTEQTAQERRQGEVIPELGGYQIQRARSPSAFQSGMGESVMLLRDVQFSYYGDLGYAIDSLSLSIKPNTEGKPVWLDEPETYKFILHEGKIKFNSVQLDAMMNRLLNPPNASLRRIKTTFRSDGTLHLVGQMQRKGKWSDFSMVGVLSRVDNKTLKFQPKNIYIGDTSADSLMAQVSLTVDELISVNLPGAQFKGNDLYINLDKAFPPPLLDVHVKNISVTEQGLSVEIYNPNVLNVPTVPETFAGSSSFIQILGGDVQFIKAQMVNARVNILPKQAGEPLKFELYRYQDQIARSTMSITADAVTTVALPAPLATQGGQK